MKKANNIEFKFSYTRLVIFGLLALFLAFSLMFTSQIETIINTGYSANNAVLDEDGLLVHFVDVGQGDSIIIEFPDNKKMIIDAGPSGSATKLLDYIDNNIFENTSNARFDYMILTHSDADHIGGADEVLDAYQVDKIYRPEIYATYNGLEVAEAGRLAVDTQIYAKTIERVLTEPTIYPVEFSFAGEIILGGDGLDAYIITFYSPSENYYSDVNEFSPIIVLQYRNRAIMLTGDANTEIEEEVVADYDLPQIDVLKLGHHGSNTSTSSELLSEINVTYAIVSAGEDNSYGHPDQETINRLIYSGVSANNIFITFENGNIIANINTSGDVSIFTQVESLPIYIEWKYVVLTLIAISFGLCFVKGFKIKTQ
ncbi:MAG: MBL fold metallo-hydrolase [Clostridia bacterium]|nr:MBL fold metallo-hydrolase [Clostridia bacterium]